MTDGSKKKEDWNSSIRSLQSGLSGGVAAFAPQAASDWSPNWLFDVDFPKTSRDFSSVCVELKNNWGSSLRDKWVKWFTT